MPGISLRQARALIDAALAKADEIGVPSNVAIVDAGNNLTAFARQDGAWPGSIDIAHGKAYTARAFDVSTKDLYAQVQPGGRCTASPRATAASWSPRRRYPNCGRRQRRRCDRS